MSGPALGPIGPAAGGLYGKLPAVGDFVRRGLSTTVVGRLQDWLQRGLAGLADGDARARDQAMLDAPSWRFAISAGVLAEAAVAGVLVQSQDRVGRIYPCLALVELMDTSPGDAVVCSSWYEQLETLLQDAVRLGAPVDEVFAGVQALGAPAGPAPIPMQFHALPGGVFVEAADGPHLAGQALAAITSLLPMAPGSSLWWRRSPEGTRMLLVDGLPVDAGFDSLFALYLPAVGEVTECSSRQPDNPEASAPESGLSAMHA